MKKLLDQFNSDINKTNNTNNDVVIDITKKNIEILDNEFDIPIKFERLFDNLSIFDIIVEPKLTILPPKFPIVFVTVLNSRVLKKYYPKS